MSDPPSLHVAADTKPVEELDQFWSRVVGAGRAAEGLRADWQRQLKQAKDACGFKYVRFHGLYHDDMHVYHETKDGVVYNFQYIDTLFDAILDIGVRPFVEFGFCPSILATETGTIFWWNANGSPPKSLEKWGDLVRATVLHWVDRYGIEEVRKWYFEVWNEANLSYFFTGTRSQYYALYEVTVNVVKAIDKSFRVGGPATSSNVPDARFDGELQDFEAQRGVAEMDDIDSLQWKPVWVEHFLNWCHSRDLPVDFVSCHPYPTDFPLDTKGVMIRRVRKVSATPDDLKITREIVSKSPFPEAEIHLTEWSSSPSSRDHAHDHVPAAVYIVRTMLASFNRVNTIAYWTFTDIFEEEGGGLTPFHGGFGMINFQGFPKPTFHAFRLLKSLGNEVLLKDENLGVVTRNSQSGLISAIIFHYPSELVTSPPPSYETRDVAEETLQTGKVERKKLVIQKLKPGTPFKVQILGPKKRGDVVWLWKSLGAPNTINRQARKILDDFSSNLDTSLVFANDGGDLVWEEDLQPWSVVSFEEVRI